MVKRNINSPMKNRTMPLMGKEISGSTPSREKSQNVV
jgi:hypothetical protein